MQACKPDDEDIVDKIKTLLSAEYDEYFEYRFMEAIRNYVQHRSLAVHSTSLGGKWTSHGEDGSLVFSTELYAHKSEVESDNAFKKKISEEMPEKVNLVYAARIYVASISKVHCDVRDMLKGDSEIYRSLISSVIKNYEEINENKSLGLNAICLEPKEPIDETIEKFPLLLDWDDIRMELIKKNPRLVNLGKRYVSGDTNNKSPKQAQ